MTKKRKNKNIIMTREAHRILELRIKGKLTHNPVIIDDKLFVTTVEEVTKEDGRQDAE